MRLLVTGSQLPDAQTFKRLLLIAEEVGFADRPSVTFEDWGTIGRASDIRQFKVDDDSPIKISAHNPPSGPAEGLYLPYIASDVRNPRFLQAVFDGLRDDDFAWKFIQPKAQHGRDLKLGTEVRTELLSDLTLPSQDLTQDKIGAAFVGAFGSIEYRRAVFKMTVIEASIVTTSTLAVTEQTGLLPVSDNRHLVRLLALRTADGHYVGGQPHASGPLAIAVASALIPDEALRKLDLKDVFEYRKATKESYAAWSTEIDRLAVRLSDMDPDAISRELPGIIHGEFRPRILEYRNELKTARDRMFGDLIKTVARWEVPSVSLAYLASLSATSAIALFVAALAPTVPAVVDYYTRRRELRRTNAAAYLVGLVSDDDSKWTRSPSRA